MKSYLVFVCLLTCGRLLLAADWPTYRHDIARSGATAEELRAPLEGHWTFKPLHGPRQAWGDPNPRPVGGWFGQTEGRRVQFDDAFHVAVAGGLVFFGSSADGCVYALDAATGRIRWSVATGGPVRLAPAVAGDSLYVGSDDGYVYCLRAADGSELWRYHAAPADEELLGSGQMISRWPVRTGVLVDGGVAYFGAGVFPAEGVFVHAVDARTGRRLWCNDERGAQPQSRFSPQGYLLASPSTLYVPTGRVSPGGLDRKTGRLQYEAYFEHSIGGTYALLSGDRMFTGTNELLGYDGKSRAQFAWFRARQLIVGSDRWFVLDGESLRALNSQTYPKASLRRKALKDRRNRERGAGLKAVRLVEQCRSNVERSRRDMRGRDAAVKQAGEGVSAAVRTTLEEAKEKLAADEKALNSALQAADLTRWQALLADIKVADKAIEDTTKWRRETACAEALILAGSVLYAGGASEVIAVDSVGGTKLWDAKVDGLARGLAVADGRLYVSTDTGAIYCFGAPKQASPVGVRQPVNANPYPRDAFTPVIEAAAGHILETSGVRKGYALMLGSGTGRLACELARRSDLVIYGVETDHEKVAVARRALRSAGLWGTRVRIDAVAEDEMDRLPYADFFANLVVSESALTDGVLPGSAPDAFRMTRPLGGVVCIGRPAVPGGAAGRLSGTALREWAETSPDLRSAAVSEGPDGVWLRSTRGALPGAGSWRQEYADPGNTTCGDDRHVKCPLGVLWYGDPGPGMMAERHRRPSAPLAINGRMFIQGEGRGTTIGAGDNVVMCYDAYNGVKLWERSLGGALRTVISHDGANAAVNDDSFFIVVPEGCVRLSADTGETTFTYKVPDGDEKARRWGYVSVVGDRVYGTRTADKRTGDAVFCLDMATGRPMWVHKARAIPQGAIAIGGGKVFLAQDDVTAGQRAQALRPRRMAAEELAGKEREAALNALQKADVRNIVTLDAVSGRVLWKRPMELTGATGNDYWCSLGSIYKNGVLVLFGVYADGHYWKQFFAGQFDVRRVFALDATDGSLLWERHVGYRVRPIVVGDTLHTEPWAFDLRTGKQKLRNHPITGRPEPWQFARPGHHCGCPAAAENLMLFRSYTLGWYDLKGDFGTQHFGGVRTSCWINFVPANGVLMVPEGGSGCMCAFPTSCTVVFHNREMARNWGYFRAEGAVTPVRHLALTLGAPGDRRASDGTLWLGYPRPGGSLVMQFPGQAAFYPGGRYFCHDPLAMDVAGTDVSWVCRSGMLGARRVVLPLVAAGEGDAVYTVRLTFAELGEAAEGQRVFDIRLQGNEVAGNVDVVRDAGGPRKTLIREFRGIHVSDKLTIELLAKTPTPSLVQSPVLQGVEIVRERVLHVGVIAPALDISDRRRRQEGKVRLTNHTGRDFVGVLRSVAPDGFAVTPAEQPVRLAQGQTVVLPLMAEVAREGPRSQTSVALTLVREDGRTEWKGQAPIDYFAGCERAVFEVVEDTWAIKKNATRNHAKHGSLVIDGGSRAVGDADHAVAYLKFRPAVSGKATRCVLRLFNAGNPTGDSGEIRLVREAWSEGTLTYDRRPAPGRVLAKIGPVTEHQAVEVQLSLSSEDIKSPGESLGLAIVPTSCDGVIYVSREGGKPAQLIIEYEPANPGKENRL